MGFEADRVYEGDVAPSIDAKLEA